MGRLDEQALDAIQTDSLTFARLYISLLQHPNANMLITGLFPASSMYIYEAHRTRIRLLPEAQAKQLSKRQLSETLVKARHSAKLLSAQSIQETTTELEAIAVRHWEYFIKPHLHKPKKILNQATDLGIFVHFDCIFTTSHMHTFSVREMDIVGEEMKKFGYEQSSYTMSLLREFGLSVPAPVFPKFQPTAFGMRDIRADALYRRAVFEKIPRRLSIALTVLLANLNYIRCVLQPFLVDNAQTRLKLKFVVAYHADVNLRAIQNSLYISGQRPTEDIQGVFKDIFSNEDSKWLKKQNRLRNLFVHYLLPDDVDIKKMPSNITRNQTIELIAGKSLGELETLLDRHIERLAEALERGFDLKGDPFSYGRVQ